MREKISQFLFPLYSPWEKVLITQNDIRYRLLMQRRNQITGCYYFKSVIIADIDEKPSLSELNVLIK